MKMSDNTKFRVKTIATAIVAIIFIGSLFSGTLLKMSGFTITKEDKISTSATKKDETSISTQIFSIRDVDGFEGIARQTFGDPTGKSYVISSVVQADIIKFVDCGTNDISSIALYYKRSGCLVGADISYTYDVCASPVRIALFARSNENSTSQALVSSVSEFVSEPLRDIIGIQYSKDSNGDIAFAAIIYKNERIS